MADARGEYWYLAPDVDATKITVPELRSILLKHGITYPSSAKKAVLVGLFNEHVVPQAAQLQRAQARTKRSTRGIVDVPSSQESAASTTTDDDDNDRSKININTPRARPVTTASQRPRVSRPHCPATRLSETPARTVPTKHARPDDGELDIDDQPAVRRSRNSHTRQASPESESPFTQDNPFQSGSSPAAHPSVARERRRRTADFEQRQRRKQDAHRRRTVPPGTEQLDDGITVPTRSTFDGPTAFAAASSADQTDLGDGDINAQDDEQPTPGEQLQLVRDRARSAQKDILPLSRRKTRSRTTGTLKAFSLTLCATTVAVLGGVWRQEKLAVGFCGIGSHSTSIAGLNIPDWATGLLPQCEPCPPHATCYPELSLVCDKDFVKVEHPLSLGGLVPLPPTCEPDSDKTRRVTLVADRAVHVLRERRAQYECGEQDSRGNLVESPDVKESDLKQELSSLKRKGLSQEEFDNLFFDAVGEVLQRDEVAEVSPGDATERSLASNSLAELPLGCSIKRSLRQAIERHLWQIALIFSLFTFGSYGRYTYTTNRAMEVRAKQLASDVFDRLAAHAANNNYDPRGYPDLGISMTQLRDDILRTEFSSGRRQKLWDKVQKKVEHNSNVRAAIRENQTGDVARMWEWVGPTHLLEHDSSGDRRKSARYTLSPASGRGRPTDVEPWDEGRPIY